MYVCMHASSTWVQERGQAAAATEENARTLLEELHACRDDVEVRFEAMRRQEEEMRDAVAAVAALEATLAALGPPRQGAGVLGELQNTLGHVRSDDSAAERSLLTVGGLKVRLRTPWPAGRDRRQHSITCWCFVCAPDSLRLYVPFGLRFNIAIQAWPRRQRAVGITCVF